MINFDFDKYCCGCAACYNICPVQAISMQCDETGFLFPHIDIEKCIDCGLCERVCPHITKQDFQVDKVLNDSWLYSSKDKDGIMKSSSGGAFYEMAKAALKTGDYVCGCCWNNNLQAEHIIINDMDDLYKLQGSKYVQSNIGKVYKEIINLLKENRKVLFSGTPCQAIAINNLVLKINKNFRKNLTIVALICHGVASPKAWETHKTYLAKKNGSKLKEVNFRDKSQEGYKKSYCKYVYEDGSTTYLPTYLPSSKWMEASIVYNLTTRNSCGQCDCKGLTAAIDIIIGDWYAIYKGDGKYGTSCITACTDTGKNYVINNLKDLKSISYTEILKYNSLIEKSTKINKNRNNFLNNLSVDGWELVERYYPKKYKLKKFLVECGLYDILKKFYK